MGVNACTSAMPAYLVAISAMLRLSSQLFKLISFDGDFNFQSESVLLEAGAWKVLRETSQKILERRAMELRSPELELLRAALDKCPAGQDVDFVWGLSFQERG